MLVVSAHVADFCTRAGGTIAKYVREGHKVSVIDLTFGQKGESAEFWSQNPGVPFEECMAQRKIEALAAAKYLGVDINFMGYSDYPLEMGADRITELALTIQNLRPDVILTHYPEDPFNEDHAVAAKAVIRAMGVASIPGLQQGTVPRLPIPNLFFFESSVPHTEFNNFKIDTFIDITDVFQIKLEAINLFTSQRTLAEPYTRYALQRGHQAGGWTKRVIKYAEGFKRYVPYVGEMLPLTDY